MNKSLYRFARYSAIGIGTLLFDLGMLYLAVSKAGIPYFIATPLCFLIAISCNYVLSRRFVFKGTERTWHHGYVYFALVALLGAGVTTALVAVLVSFFGMFYLLARVLVAGFVGVANYLFNLYFNFQVVNQHE